MSVLYFWFVIHKLLHGLLATMTLFQAPWVIGRSQGPPILIEIQGIVDYVMVPVWKKKSYQEYRRYMFSPLLLNALPIVSLIHLLYLH